MACSGRVFSSAGDGFMLEFGSSAEAVEAMLRLATECEPKVRIGAHLGDVVIQADGDLLGHGVNVAARLMALAAPGGIVISSDVRRTIRGPLAARFVSRGTVRLEKMSESIEIFDYGEGPVPQGGPDTTHPRRVLIGGMVALMVIAATLALMQFGGAIERQEASIAVMAFADLSVDRDQEYFADGISEEILNALARVDGLHVAGRTSSFSFKGQNTDAREVGARLSVAHLLEGSVRRDGARVRITAQLVRVEDGMNVWSRAYDRELIDILTVQQEIANEIVSELQVPLGQRTNFGGARSTHVEAYDAYLRGRSLLWSRTDVAEAARQLERAVELDPEFAAAWAALADAYIAVPGWLDEYEGIRPVPAVFQRRAEGAALRALELDPNIAATYHALSVVYRDRWQWARAEQAIDRAIEIEPGSPYLWEDRQEFLENVGRWRDSAEAIEAAVRIDPLNPFYQAIHGIAYWHLRDYGRAEAAMRRALEVNPDLQGFQIEYVAILVDAGRSDEALSYLRDCSVCDETASAFMQRAIEHARTRTGAFDYGDELQSTFGDYVFRGLVGGDELVLARLEEVAAAGELVPLAINNRAIASVRDTERYRALVRATGLEDYWRANGWPSFCRPIGAGDFRCRE